MRACRQQYDGEPVGSRKTVGGHSLDSQIQVQRVDVCRSLRLAAQDGLPYHLRRCPRLHAVRDVESRQEQSRHMCADLGLGARRPSVQSQGNLVA